MNIFNMDSKFYRFITRLGELMILNVLFLAGCIGVITIGSSIAAMYTVLLRMVRNESGYIVRMFWRAFWENLRQSVILWGISIAAGLLLYFDIILSDMRGGALGWGLKIVFLFLGILYVSVLSYLFPVQSRFENTLWNTLKNSFWMAVGYLPFTLSILVVECIPLFAVCVKPVLFWYLIPVMATFGFSGLGFVCAGIFNHIFKNYIPEEETES